MGALTAKKISFSYRNWENRAFQEIDDTEVSLFRIRIEKLKNRRLRVLPIKYWISNEKRYLPEKQKDNASLLAYNIISYYSLKTYEYVEKLRANYLSDSHKISYSIIQKFFEKKQLNFFLGRVLSDKTFLRSPISCNIFLYDLYNSINPFEDKQQIVYSRFELSTSKVLLLTNPRYLSPSYNTFLYTMNAALNEIEEPIEITSCSSFSSSFEKDVIPYSNFIIDEINSGKHNLDDTTIVTALNTPSISSIIKAPIVRLYPLFLQTNITYDSIQKNTDITIDCDFSYGAKRYMRESFVSPISSYPSSNSSIYITLNNHSFDQYLLTDIDLRMASRLFLLFYMTMPIDFMNHRRIFMKYKEAKNKAISNGLLTRFDDHILL